MSLDPESLGCKCAECPYAVQGKPGAMVAPSIPPDARGLLVGDMPAKEDVEAGRPFGGHLGFELKREMREAGIDPATIGFANATLCGPTGKPNDKELIRAAKCCRPAFVALTGGVRPTLAMGKGAAFAVVPRGLPKGGLFAARGFIRADVPPAGGSVGPDGADRLRYIITWGPRFALRGNTKHAGEFLTDLARFGRLLNGTLRPGPKALITNPTVEDLQRLYEEGKAGTPIAVDIETAPQVGGPDFTGKDPTRARLKTIGLGTEEWGLSLEARRTDLHTAVKRILLDADICKVFHNGFFFDLPVLRRHGFHVY